MKFSNLKPNNFFKRSCVAFLFFLILSSCEKDKQEVIVTSQLKESLQNGTWRITKFIDSGVNELSHFNGFEFIFNVTGNLIAKDTKSNLTYNGVWSITKSYSNDNSNDGSDFDLNIFFNTTLYIEELNDDWDIISESPTRVELRSVSGGNGGIDLLTFEKK
jgi:hypothetical protein